jgi:hypothetical protein
MNGYLSIIGKALTKFRNLQRNRYISRAKGIPWDNHQRSNTALGGIIPKQRLAMIA